MRFLRWLNHALNHEWGPEVREGRLYYRACYQCLREKVST